MKKLIYILILPLIMVFGGCNVLTVDNDEKLSGDDFWNDPDNVGPFVLSMYNSFRNATMVNSPMLTASGDMRCAPLAPYNTRDNLYVTYLAENDLNTLVEKRGDYAKITRWDAFYEVVQEANILLEEIGDVEGLDGSDAARFKAEAVFMRSLAYFFLVRLYGDVPYYTNAYNYRALPRAGMVTVLKNCLADLQGLLDNDPDAEILPWTYTTLSKRATRAMRGSVLALMMHVNMWLAKFDESVRSEDYYRRVMLLGDELVHRNGGAYALLSLDRTSAIFRGGSEEGLFEIAQNITAGEYFDKEAIFGNKVVATEKILRPVMFYSSDFMRQIFPVHVTDKRVTAWFDENIYDSDLAGSSSSLNKKEIYKFLNSDTQTDGSMILNAGNQIVFRYADAILLYAEAAAAVGEDGVARDLVNMIRDRAGADRLTSTGDGLKDDIYWERVRELIGEGHYFYDLVRTGKLCDRNYCSHAITLKNFNAGAWTWPIHKDALVNNTQMNLNDYWN